MIISGIWECSHDWSRRWSFWMLNRAQRWNYSYWIRSSGQEKRANLA